ncbi:anhydro-N-acetylmuramic acid kinase [Candidatus Pelagibacter sp.]|nr:anhydro-N-acetylmuramic acid kinase [Candidatus Pelagibacter sp.]
MKQKLFTSIGLMSGTSMDGVDISIIQSDGQYEFHNILDEYFEYDADLQAELIRLRNIVLNQNDLLKNSEELVNLERKITVFHAEKINHILLEYKKEIDLIGFHGQTIFHNPQKKITKQLGDGNLLSQLLKKKVVYDFRQKDIENGGQGAPLTPIFHYLLSNIINEKFKTGFPIGFINIGGITNLTNIKSKSSNLEENITAFDLGPGNCLIDDWVRKNSNKKFDENGNISRAGKIDQLITNQIIDNFKLDSYSKSLDVKDFDNSFARGLSLENGCSTITNFTGYLIAKGIENTATDNKIKYLISGGGRKNIALLDYIKDNLDNKNSYVLDNIDKYGFNGDHIESQAFGYLAIRSFLNFPISFPATTGCKEPTIGGKLVENF